MHDAQGDTLDPTYSVMIVLLSSMAGTFFRMRSVYACACNWLLVAVFLVITALADTYDSGCEHVVCLPFVAASPRLLAA